MEFFIQACLVILCDATVIAQEAALPTSTLSQTTNSIESAWASVGFTLDDKHILESGDQISFQILEDRKPAIGLVVTDSSELSIPYVGRVSAAGKTCRQLAADLKILLERDYYYRATVILGLNSVNKVRGQVLVWGEVRNQGAIDILASHTLTVGEAILRAGGFGDFADKKKIKVVRNRANTVKPIVEVNLADMVEKGATEKDVTLEPGDYVIVPHRLLRF